MEESASAYDHPLYFAGPRRHGCGKGLSRTSANINGAPKGAEACVIAFDGKTLRGSFDNFNDAKAKQVLSAFAVDTALALAHIEIDEKSNEIPAVQRLLAELDVAGCIVTCDAMHAQKTFEVAAAANAHLIVQLKDNQPILRREAEAICSTATPLSRESRVDKNRRNRHETRTVAVFDATQAVIGTEWEPHVAAIIRIERTVFHFLPATGLWKHTCEISFYLSSRPITAKTAATAVRNPWAIENTSHHSRDVTFCEDASRIRKNPGVFARLRSFAYNILKRNQTDTVPQAPLAAAFGGLKSMLAMKFSGEH